MDEDCTFENRIRRAGQHQGAENLHRFSSLNAQDRGADMAVYSPLSQGGDTQRMTRKRA